MFSDHSGNQIVLFGDIISQAPLLPEFIKDSIIRSKYKKAMNGDFHYGGSRKEGQYTVYEFAKTKFNKDYSVYVNSYSFYVSETTYNYDL